MKTEDSKSAQQTRDALLKVLDNEFRHLYEQMQKSTHRKAVKELFNASAEELNNSYRADQYEKKPEK